MRIAIDARLNAYRQGGIPQYTRQLLTAMAEVAPNDQFISLQHRDQLRPLAIAPNVTRRTALTPPHHRFEGWTLPLEMLLARPDVLHCPDFIAPLRRPCPGVVTIHDLAFMHYPDILDEAAGAYYGQVRANAPRADAVIAVSEATRQDIAQFLDIPIEQIDVIYEAAAPLYKPIELRAGEARVLNATPIAAGSFMLFVSTLEPRKNVPTLLQALRICLDRRPNTRYRLVLAGRRGWRDEEIFQTVRDLQLGDYVFFAGGVGQYDLRWLYNACRIYINPSLYEGFGLPLLEAMACGAPCLAAATSSLPEIGGDAAIYVPPLDADTWADEIAALWIDEERRDELGRLGTARAARFSWLRAARETLNVYRRAAARIVPQPAPLPRAPRDSDLAADQIDALGTHAAPAPGDARLCLRCGATMLAGAVQHSMLVHTTEAINDGRNHAARAWACPRCGHLELVVDWAPNAHAEAEHTPALERVIGVSALPPILPIELAGPAADTSTSDRALPAPPVDREPAERAGQESAADPASIAGDAPAEPGPDTATDTPATPSPYATMSIEPAEPMLDAPATPSPYATISIEPAEPGPDTATDAPAEASPYATMSLMADDPALVPPEEHPADLPDATPALPPLEDPLHVAPDQARDAAPRAQSREEAPGDASPKLLQSAAPDMPLVDSQGNGMAELLAITADELPAEDTLRDGIPETPDSAAPSDPSPSTAHALNGIPRQKKHSTTSRQEQRSSDSASSSKRRQSRSKRR